ncbi:SDR family NAD(P)-dependent oxidoreductase [Tateyamaria omphalii]|uniref:SDR family NAD(P)-dependent oxidoreductase n=1 Tax=Tateyamaria omphalii TaxID=299262 RepID=UPI001C996535|nr:SDR family NAD(P)-dependent oxidoreductase [Tateyamaria omphalii]MBY5932131.1 SDR family NAD(P)-dependent oxidoreductase [Tateyamaria omphalii]
MPRALVTGGNRGIGYAMAEGLRARGVEVVIGVRDAQAGAAAAAGIACDWVHLDLEAPETFAPAIADAGEIDILINNAGILIEDSMIAHPEGLRRSMQVMFHAPFELILLCLPHMARAGGGRIINVSSGWGAFDEGLEGPGGYGVAKAALNAMSHALPRDLPAGVSINAMCPGWVHTRMGGQAAPRTPEEGADTAIWLALDAPAHLTGKFFRDRQEKAW